MPVQFCFALITGNSLYLEKRRVLPFENKHFSTPFQTSSALVSANTEWYVENGDTRTLANLQVLQSKLNHPRQ